MSSFRVCFRVSEWRGIALTELGSVERGRSRHRPRNDPSLYGGDVPFFQTGDVKVATLHMRNPGQWYSAKGVAQSRIWEPGTACITIAANISETAILGCRGCFPDSILGFMPKHQSCDAYFVKYLLDVYRDELTSAARGTTQDNLSLEKLLSYRFRVPEARTRARIAATLRAVDDLIENNRRRVEVLEKMARAIYREWFVNFRYPGHENATRVDSTLGPIPDGWDVKSICETSNNFDRLRKPLSKLERSRRPGSVPYYGAAKLIDRVDDWIFDGEYLLFAEDGSVQTADGFPVLQLVEEKFWANNHTHILQGDGVSTRFLYLAAADQPIIGYVTGAAQPKITQANLNRIPLIVGTPEVHRAFEGAIDPIFDAWRVLQKQASTLVQMRDALLPKLVTGQIDVSSLDLDALVEGSVA